MKQYGYHLVSDMRVVRYRHRVRVGKHTTAKDFQDFLKMVPPEATLDDFESWQDDDGDFILEFVNEITAQGGQKRG